MRNPSLRAIKNYLVGEAFAWGGTASVHLARALGDQDFSRVVAIKQLHAPFARDEEFVRMFLDEGRLLSRIHHSNVVAPIDVVVNGDQFLVVMEYVHGEALSRLAGTGGTPLAPPLACAIVLQVLAGLHAAHEARDESGRSLELVHRDVSPQNILIGADGNVRVADFGIAKAAARVQTTHHGTLKGKPGYLAPEQRRGDPVDRRTDVFAVGIVLWELLAGRRLFPDELSLSADCNSLLEAAGPPSRWADGVPAAVDALVARALAVEPARRFATAREMALELERGIPLVSPSALAAWVETEAASTLAARANCIGELERIVASELTQRRTLTPARLPAASSSWSLAGMDSPLPAVDSPVPLALPSVMRGDGPANRRSLRTFGALAVLAVLGGFAASRVLEAPRSAVTTVVTRAPHAASSEPRKEPIVALNVAASRPADGAAATAEPARLAANGAPPDVGAAQSLAPGRRTEGVRRASVPKSGVATAGCDVPFTIGSDGVKRYDPECFP